VWAPCIQLLEGFQLFRRGADALFVAGCDGRGFACIEERREGSRGVERAFGGGSKRESVGRLVFVGVEGVGWGGGHGERVVCTVGCSELLVRDSTKNAVRQEYSGETLGQGNY